MALSLMNPEVVHLAAEVAALAGETKTEAVRKALGERKARLIAARSGRTRSQRAASILAEFRAGIPPELLGRPLTR